MEISYDRKVLASAKRAASKPGALQRDLLRHFKDRYVNEETHDEIAELMYSLPRRP